MGLTCNPEIADDSTVDFFVRLPDEIVRSIFKKLQDGKSLCMSMAACKRFRSIVPLVDEISLSIPKRRAKDSDSIKNPVVRVLMKPFNFFSQKIKSRSKVDENDLDFYTGYLQNEILKSFGEIRGLRLRLPGPDNRIMKCGKCGKPPWTLLRWKAEFGRDLHSCVILGARSCTDKSSPPQEPDPDSRPLPDCDLKMRIMWTIYCVHAACARHYLIQGTVKRLKSIESVAVLDEIQQGRLVMNGKQIEELRAFDVQEVDMPKKRSRVPALRVKMWYLEKLEVGDSGKVMEGATLVVIKPAAVVGSGGIDGGDVLGFGDEGEGTFLDEAVAKLLESEKIYTCKEIDVD